ncbi:hypothetical protein OBBRIDRAFT_835463 [Obba rivulosa]|uniref:Uncharacterized protein n=1 Tax=Obba rivulosa TaxID=1052685 RepID=A0A8E2ARX7_9APHY|nr:hypothetical protein OBBRIDRAFT_835463 [Obba rivulosa]
MMMMVNLGPEFKIANWPCWTDEAKKAIKDMVDTHDVFPIPVYGHDDQLIHPSLYRTILQGATVKVYFSLRHWAISKGDGAGMDAYSADAFAIHVVKPAPPPTPSTPQKCKISTASPVSSPKKRRLGGMSYFIIGFVFALLIAVFTKLDRRVSFAAALTRHIH